MEERGRSRLYKTHVSTYISNSTYTPGCNGNPLNEVPDHLQWDHTHDDTLASEPEMRIGGDLVCMSSCI